ncbi:sec-independent translocase [Rubripirellula obstinata]|uniref:Sec-independent translocase n=1 Tax=Rubripirellula obstinata TaxID=406547 RepID=A0A5B1CCG4_9BACT|nr:twin-arginine translocase TatA/TatE family subunit [Rubripirellula obstinata]KAA1257715.1 sec-independent translocase [Rubripirellula obstinata]
MFGLGPFEMVVIGVIAVLLFGGNLPEVARKLGGSYRELRRSLNDVQQQFRVAEFEAKKALDVTKLDEPKKSASDDDQDDEDSSKPSAPKFTPPS